MTFFLLGIFCLATTGAGFWYSLPQQGRVRPFVNTLAEPYVAIAVACGLVLSLGMIASGIVNLLF